MQVTIHGIRNCDTVKKARGWLDAQGIAHRFRDYKAEPPQVAELAAWAKALGWEKLLNRAGTSFRKLPEEAREGLDEARAVALMLAQPSLIKRPLLEVEGGAHLGFTPEAYQRLFAR